MILPVKPYIRWISWIAWAPSLVANGLLAAADPSLIDSGHYADSVAAQAAWRPMGGTALVTPAEVDGQPALRMPCNFAAAKLERASWDRQVSLDLAICQGIQFEIFCRDASPVSHFSLYLQSGQGWYHASFFPARPGEWNKIILDKAAFHVEGRPAGWAGIQTIRLSAWCGKEQNTELFFRHLRRTGVLGADALVAILRNEAAARAQPDEAKTVEQFCESMAAMLNELNIPAAIVSDLDVTAEKLRPAQLVILPHNPQTPAKAAEELVKYAATGKVMAFYSVPEKLRPLLGVQGGRHIKEPAAGAFSQILVLPGALSGAPERASQHSWNINAYQPIPGVGRVLAEWADADGKAAGHAALIGSPRGMVMSHVLLNDGGAAKRRLLLAMVGSLAPEIWRRAAENKLARMGQVNGYEGFEAALKGIHLLAPANPVVKTTLAEAERLRIAAQSACQGGQHAEALDHAALADRKLLEAFCRAQRPQPGEFRAFWCHSAFGVKGMTWDQAIKQLADHGFTAILPNMLWGGVAYYPSQLLPAAKENAAKGDQIAECLAACRKYGVQMHVWKVNWNLGHAAPKEWMAQMQQAGRLQQDAKGKEEPWLCPSHPANQKLEIDSMVEVARLYAVDGIHFDYIRYPGSDHCFCPGCRARFEKVAAKPLPQWPREVLAKGEYRARWLDWRRDNITAVVKAVSEQARRARPGLKISAAVFPRWATDRDSVGQDWKLWCEKGYLDFVCPMDYTPHNAGFENLVAQQAQWAGRTPVYPGIGVSASSSKFGADRAIEQILITRKYRTGGFTIFNYGATEAGELLPLLGLGVTAK